MVAAHEVSPYPTTLALPVGGAASARDLGLRIEVATDRAAIAGLREAWTALEGEARGTLVFQSHAFASLVADACALAGAQARFEPLVLVLRRGGAVAGIWPLRVFRFGTRRFACDLADPFGQYADLVLSPMLAPTEAVPAALAALGGLGFDGLVLRKVRADSVLAEGLGTVGPPLGPSAGAPRVVLSRFSHFDAYRATISVSTRKKLRNARNRLSRHGDLAAVEARGRDGAGLIRLAARNRRAWLEAQGLTSTAFSHPAFPHLVETLAQGGAPALDARAFALTLAAADAPARPVATQWGFVHGGAYVAYVTAKDPAFDGFSPGRLHLNDVIAALAHDGVGTIDLLMPDMPYKASVATETSVVQDRGVPLTSAGAAILKGWYGFARPTLRAAFLSLPSGLRRRIVPAVGAPVASAKGE